MSISTEVNTSIDINDLANLAVAFATDKEGGHHYAQHYQHHFESLRYEKLNILEIGIGGYENPKEGGASLRMWKAYFPNSRIFGIDIHDKSYHDEDRIKTFRGSQVDEEFLKKVVEEIGTIDIIIDDGSHISEHVIKTFQILFPLMSPNGIYVVEDLQTSYWETVQGEQWGGSKDLTAPHTSMNFFKSRTDGLNYEEFTLDPNPPSYFDKHIVSMHFYHNLVFLYKGLNDEGSNVLGKRDGPVEVIDNFHNAVGFSAKNIDLRLRWLNIEFSSICNLRCRWCILDHEKPKQFLTLDSFEKILKQIVNGELPDLERIDLHNGGEALLHPQIDEALELLAKYRKAIKQSVHISLLTNGTVLKETTLALLTSGNTVDEIRVSVDGGTPYDFEYIRTNAKWEKVSENVKRIHRAIKTNNSKTTLGIICMVALDKPLEVDWMDSEFREVVQLADNLELRHPHTWEGSLNGKDGLLADVDRKQKNRVCMFLKRNLVVMANGEVTVCCADLNGRGTIGHVEQQKLAEILNGDKRQQMVELWRQGRFDEIPICSTCQGHYDESEPLDDELPQLASESRELELENMTDAQIDETKKIIELEMRAANTNMLNLKLLIDIARINIKQQNFFEAYKLIQKALNEIPGYELAKKNLMHMFELIDAKKKEDNWSSRKSAQFVLDAEKFIQLNDLTTARNKLLTVLNFEPMHVEAMNDLSVVSILENKFEDALDIIKTVLSLEPTNEIAVGNMNYLQGEMSVAEPSIKFDKYSSFKEFENNIRSRKDELNAQKKYELSLINGTNQIVTREYCHVCGSEENMIADFSLSTEVNGVKVPIWRESLNCTKCNLNARMRASIHLFEDVIKPGKDSIIYISEQVTIMYDILKDRYPNLVGSEYLQNKVPLGNEDENGIRNEDVTQLSFKDSSVDTILSFDVLEHVPDYKKAFKECFRVIKPGGSLFFSVPFIKSSPKTIVRSKIDENGNVIHLLPPHYHGDPLSSEGCLCYYHFGWDVLDSLKDAGFDDAYIYTCWSKEFAYLGGEHVYIVASKKTMLQNAERLEVNSNQGYLNAQAEMSLIHIKQKNYFDAYLLLQRVLIIDATHETARKNFAILNEQIASEKNKKKWNSRKSADGILKAEKYIQEEKLSEANAKLLEILNFEPTHIEALNDLSAVSILESKFDYADDLIKAVLTLDPVNEIAIGNLNYLNSQVAQSRYAAEIVDKTKSSSDDRIFIDEKNVVKSKSNSHGSLQQSTSKRTKPKGLICLNPFYEFEIDITGKVVVCCTAWLKHGLGNMKNHTIGEIWNSQAARYIRRKMYKGEWEDICNASCPTIVNYTKYGTVIPFEEIHKDIHLTHKHVEEILAGRDKLESTPTVFKLSDSKVCNLKCKMCSVIHSDELIDDQEMLERRSEDLKQYLDKAKTILVSGNGDPFARKDTRELLMNYIGNESSVEFSVVTNGLLLPRYWDKVKHQKFEAINVSVDAATKEVYEKIRYPGKWEDILKTLALLRENKKSFKNILISMVVMRSNYKQIPAFNDMVESYGFMPLYSRIHGMFEDENIFEMNDKVALDELRAIVSSEKKKVRSVNVIWQDIEEFAN